MAPASLSYNTSSFLQTIGLVTDHNSYSNKRRPSSPSSFSSSSSSSSSSCYSPAMADGSRTLARQQYARLLADSDHDLENAMADNTSDDSIAMTPTSSSRRRSRKSRQSTKTEAAAARPGYLPTARRFWADFTLGFADGLTVPFALTAGLSSLGRTDTVVYAGMAEVSAGCISMGIGGYLSARQAASGGGDNESPLKMDDEEAAPEMVEIESGREKTTATTMTPADLATAAHRYLAPLALPADLHQQLLAHVTTQPHAAEGLLAAVNGDRKSEEDSENEYGYGYYEPPAKETDDDVAVWPIASGISVALGYLIGGLLPLWPYFFVQNVGDGLRYSFAVCVVALFLFGFVKDFVLDAPSSSSSSVLAPSPSYRRARVPWRRLWKSTFEGLQMVILGGIAAIAAVLCVRLFEGANSMESS
ncbi:hypothetical protein SCUCBS95973_009350 [Sporothrix curviconia]|uniref:Vacuolar iron transporter n=1 Tax=Sporothrix curviconia TaxID=1260050 RepID=A0ABP0CV78_9PEZI